MESFKCPRCGGRYFGAIMAKDLETIIRYDCHSNLAGTDQSLSPNGKASGECGWSGQREECISEGGIDG